jgi:predicted dehydrogenase
MSEKVDIANARITFASGCVANVTASRVTGKTMQKIRFFGFEGYHAVDYGKRELVSLCRKNSAGGKVEISANPVEVKILDPLQEEIRSFIESVINRKQPPVTGREGRDALELALLIADKVKQSQELLP